MTRTEGDNRTMDAPRKDNPLFYDESRRRAIEAINAIRGMGGESYAKQGLSELARRNPVKEDTGPALTGYAFDQEPAVVFELGTAYGYSADHIAMGYPQAQIFTVEFDSDVAAQAQDHFDRFGINATVLPGDAADVIARWDGRKVNMFFADHDKKLYLPHFKAMERHLAPGAVILGDNVNDRRAECGDFVEYVLGRYKGHILPTEAGLLVARVPAHFK